MTIHHSTITIAPADLYALWNADNGVSVALLLDWLRPDEKDALARSYADWLSETQHRRFSVAEVERSFVEVGWKLERDDLDFTAASRSVRSLVEQSGCLSRVAIITVLLQGAVVRKEAA